MIKIVLNACHGGFGLSEEAVNLYNNYCKDGSQHLALPKDYESSKRWCNDLDRDDPILIRVVEELREKANGDCAKLRIANINCSNLIDEYDGYENVIGMCE